jgi:hypothetical protein
MKFRKSGLLALACVDLLTATQYKYVPYDYYPDLGSPWSFGTTWNQNDTNPPTFVAPDLNGDCYIGPEHANGEYTINIDTLTCQAQSFSIPQGADNYGGVAFFLNGQSNTDVQGILNLSPKGQDGIFVSNQPTNPSLSGDSFFQGYFWYLNFVTDGNIHNSMKAFYDDYGQYITSAMSVDGPGYIYGAGSNLTFINDDTCLTGFGNYVVGSDSGGNNSLNSISFSGDGAISFISSNVGTNISLINLNSVVGLIKNTLFASDAGVFTMNGGTLTLDPSSRVGPVFFLMNGGYISNKGILSFGSTTNTSALIFQGAGIDQGGAATGDIFIGSNANINTSVQQNNINLGVYSDTLGALSSQSALVNLNGTLVGNISISPLGTLTGIGMILGPVTSEGSVYSPYITIGASNYVDGNLTFSTNPITSSSAYFGPQATISILGGQFSQFSSSHFATGGQLLSMSFGNLSSDATSIIGPTPLIYTGGQISSAGDFTIGLISGGTFQSGTSYIGAPLSGGGNLYMAQNATVSAQVDQTNVYIGLGLDLSHNPQNAPSNVFVSSTVNASVTVGTGSLLTGPGVINGNIINYGTIYSATITIGSGGANPLFLDLNSSTINSYNGIIGSGSLLIYETGGVLSQYQESSFAFGAGGLAISGGQIYSDASSFIGPVPVAFTNGLLSNDGFLSIGLYQNGAFSPSQSNLSTGSIEGVGSTYITGTVSVGSSFVFAQENLFVGEGFNLPSNSVNSPAFLTLAGSISASITNSSLAQIVGNGFLSGTLTNYGKIYSPIIIIGTNSSSNISLDIDANYPIYNSGYIADTGQSLFIDGGFIYNYADSYLGGSGSLITVTGGSISSDQGNIALYASNIIFNDAYLNLTTSSSLAYQAGALTILGGTIVADATSKVGPCPLNMSGGYLGLDGILTIGIAGSVGFLPSNSTISGGSITSNGPILLAGNLLINNTVTIDEIDVGAGYLVSGTINANATLKVNGTLNSNIQILPQGLLTGNGGIVFGGIYSEGTIFAQTLFLGASQATPFSLSLDAQSLELVEESNLGVGSGSLTILGGSIYSDHSNIGGGNLNQYMSISGGTIYNFEESSLANQAFLFHFFDGYLENDQTSFIGPATLRMSGGYLVNDGTMTLAAYSRNGSKLTGGSITGSGDIVILGTTTFKVPVTQALVVVGGESQLLKASSTGVNSLIVNDQLNADVTVNADGNLIGTGPIHGNITNYGTIFPGSNPSKVGLINVIGDVTLESNSAINFALGPNLTSSQIVIDGTLSSQNYPTLIIDKQTHTQYVGVVVFDNIITALTDLTTVSDFKIQSPYQVRLIPAFLGYSIEVDFSSLQTNDYVGNAKVMAENLDVLNGYCSLDLQDDIDVILRLNYDNQRAALLELCPQFKLIQYGLEKFLMSQDDMFSKKLQMFQKGVTPYLDLGFDQYAQDAIQPIVYGYNQYKINTWTQNVGLTYGSDHGSLGFDLGFSQSYFSFKDYPAKARYKTGSGMIGYAGKKDRFEGALDFFGSYSQIRSSRYIALFNRYAKHQNHAFNLASSFVLGYRQPLGSHYRFKPYDKIGYIYGKESAYQDQGAQELDLSIKTETLSLARNSLGFELGYSTSSFDVDLDLAWVYEHIFSHLRYKGKFVGTDSYMDFYATPQRSQFAKGYLGATYQKDGFKLGLSYQALVAQKFLEQTGKLSFSKQF